MCSISHLKQTTQLCRHRVKMYGLKNCDHHVLAPDIDQINRIKLVQEPGGGGEGGTPLNFG